MKHDLKCSLCDIPGYGNYRVWYKQVLLLAVQPNLRGSPKRWVCRKCIWKNRKLSDEDFIKLFNHDRLSKHQR